MAPSSTHQQGLLLTGKSTTRWCTCQWDSYVVCYFNGVSSVLYMFRLDSPMGALIESGFAEGVKNLLTNYPFYVETLRQRCHRLSLLLKQPYGIGILGQRQTSSPHSICVPRRARLGFAGSCFLRGPTQTLSTIMAGSRKLPFTLPSGASSWESSKNCSKPGRTNQSRSYIDLSHISSELMNSSVLIL